MKRALVLLLLLLCGIADAQPVVTWRPPMNCSANDGLKWSGTAWVCTGGPTVTGSGTSGKSVRWASASSIGDGAFTDDGTNATIAGDLKIDVSTSNADSPELDYTGYNGSWFSGIDTANQATSRDFVVAGLRPVFSCEDAVINGTTTITSAAQCGFSSSLIGKAITGTDIPPGTTIASVAGPTSATLSQAATGSGTIRATITRTFTANDVIYLKHRGGLPTTIGFGITPPSGSYRLQVSPDDSEVAMGGLGIRVGPSQTGKAFVVHDSSPTERFWVTSDFYLSGLHAGTGSAIGIQAESTNERPLALVKSDKTRVYAFQYSSNNLRFRYVTGGVDAWQVSTAGDFATFGNATLGDATGDTTKQWGHLTLDGTAPTLSSCGTSPTITGTDRKGVITVGSGGTACTVTFSRTHTSNTTCTVSSRTKANDLDYSVSATAITISAATAAGVYDYECACIGSSCT